MSGERRQRARAADNPLRCTYHVGDDRLVADLIASAARWRAWAWVADLEHWEMDGGTSDEPAVAEALLRLTYRASARLKGTGQDRGPTSAQLAEAPSIQRMRECDGADGGPS